MTTTSTKPRKPSQDVHSVRQPFGCRCECAEDAYLAAVSHVHIHDGLAYTWAWHVSNLADLEADRLRRIAVRGRA